jgi:PTS system ascorbate-specific IIA component
MSLMTIKNPVKFGSEFNDPVKLLITIAPKDSESHLKALSQLMALFTNSEDLKKVMSGKSKEDIISIINKYSK